MINYNKAMLSQIQAIVVITACYGINPAIQALEVENF